MLSVYDNAGLAIDDARARAAHAGTDRTVYRCGDNFLVPWSAGGVPPDYPAQHPIRPVCVVKPNGTELH